MNGATMQNWAKSLAPSILTAITVAILLWLNVPSKSDIQDLKTDIRELRTEVKADMRELRSEIGKIRTNYMEHLSYHVETR